MNMTIQTAGSVLTHQYMLTCLTSYADILPNIHGQPVQDGLMERPLTFEQKCVNFLWFLAECIHKQSLKTTISSQKCLIFLL